MKRTLSTILIIALTAVSAMGQTASELKQRMNDRLPAIIELKTTQTIGENNQAYLAILKEVTEAQAILVQEENADRRSVYTMLAKQINAPIDLVQKKRAAQLRDLASPGTMVQTPEGEWIVKN